MLSCSSGLLRRSTGTIFSKSWGRETALLLSMANEKRLRFDGSEFSSSGRL